jgi:hypothetical protein
MQKLRSYTLIWLVLSVLTAGVAAHWLAGLNSDRQYDELTEWLLSFADKHQKEQAIALIRTIDKGISGHEQVIARASEIFVMHPELFNLPVDGSTDDQDNVRVALLVQWDLHSQASGMSSAVQPERNRNATNNPADSQTRQFIAVIDSLFQDVFSSIRASLPGMSDLVDHLLKPLINGISINAP